MKAKLNVLMALLLCIAVMVGCQGSTGDVQSTEANGGGGQEEGTTAAKEDKQEKVTLRVLTRWSDDIPQSVAFRERLDMFSEQNPNIKIENISVNDESAFNDKWKTSVATGDIPEVFQNYGGENFRLYVENNLLMDLTQVLNEDEAWKNDFLPLFENWRFDSVEGVYGVPYEFYGIGIFYNKEIFETHGLEAPKTMKEFYAVSEALKEKGIIPMAMGAKDSWRGGHLFNNLLFKQHGFAMAKALGTREMRYDDPEVVEIFAMMQEMNDMGIFGENILGVDYNAEKAQFFNGETAMHMDGSWFLGEAAASEIAGVMGFIPFPSFEAHPEHAGVWQGGGAGLSISGLVEGPQKEAAIKLLKFLSSKEHFAYLQAKAEGGVYPVKLDKAEGIDPITVMYQEALSDATDVRGDVQQYDPLTQMVDKARNAIQGLFAGISPEDTGKELSNEIDNAN